MDQKVQQILMKVASYIASTQPIIDKHNEERINFTKRATQTAGVLANRGIIGANQVNTFIDKVAADPTEILGFVEKLASIVSADALGSAVQTKAASGGSTDPWELAFFPGLRGNSGMVE